MNPYLHLPARAGRVSAEEYARRAKSPVHLRWNVPEMDDYLIPMSAGDAVGLVARPGHGKTTSMIYLCKSMSETVARSDPDGIIIYATWETLIEEFTAVYNAERSGQSLDAIGRGNADMKRLKDALAMSMTDNVAVVGRSMERDDKDKVRMPIMHTLDDVDECVNEVQRSGKRVYAILLDYLQRIPATQRGVDRSTQVAENTERIKDMALRHATVTISGIQAGRDVDQGGGLKIPGLDSGQWASNIEQTLDKYYAITRPYLYMAEGQDIILSKSGLGYKCSPDLLIMKVLKQRWGSAGRVFVNSFDPAMCMMLTKKPDLTNVKADLF